MIFVVTTRHPMLHEVRASLVHAEEKTRVKTRPEMGTGEVQTMFISISIIPFKYQRGPRMPMRGRYLLGLSSADRCYALLSTKISVCHATAITTNDPVFDIDALDRKTVDN